MPKIEQKNKGEAKFLDLKVNVFINKRNGQLMITLPKKILKNIPPEMNIGVKPKFFKKINKKGGKK